MNNRGAGTAFSWVYGLISLFGVGIIYIIFNEVFTVYLLPTVVSNINSTTTITTATKNTIFAQYAQFMTFFHFLPYILFLAVTIYLILASWRKEAEGGYY